MNDKIKLFTALTALYAIGQEPETPYVRRAAPAPTPEEREAKAEKIALSKGLRAFMYGDTVIYALNQRSADKKAGKIKNYKV